jgi:hypothetical protein
MMEKINPIFLIGNNQSPDIFRGSFYEGKIALKKDKKIVLGKEKKGVYGFFAKEAGFSLVEVTLAILLTALLGGVIFRLLQASEKGFNTGWSVAEFNREAQKTLACMGADLRAAQNAQFISKKLISINQYDHVSRYEIVTAHNQHLIFRKVNRGGGWTYSPKRPVARFSIDNSDSLLTFSLSDVIQGFYQIRLMSAKQGAQARICRRF